MLVKAYIVVEDPKEGKAIKLPIGQFNPAHYLNTLNPVVHDNCKLNMYNTLCNALECFKCDESNVAD